MRALYFDFAVSDRKPDMRIRLASVVMALAVFASPLAAQGVQTQRLLATDLSLDADPKTDPTAMIWQDKLPAIRALRQRAAATTPSVPISENIVVFDATFRDGDKTVILSVIRSPLAGDCENYSGAGFLSGNTWFDALQKENGEVDNETAATKTMVTFNPAARELIVAGVANGKPDEAPGPPIFLTY
jgi:hypothetical protein